MHNVFRKTSNSAIYGIITVLTSAVATPLIGAAINAYANSLDRARMTQQD